MGFFKLRSASLADHAKTGAAIMRVSQSAFQSTPNSEWVKFDKDTRQWLYDNGYEYTGSADGKIPPTIDIVPVYDTPTKMHVRIPWAKDLENAPAPVDDTYNGSFPAFLARYFMRRCR